MKLPTQEQARVVAKKFIQQWVVDPQCIGALLVGSYATNLQTPRSDIDVCVLFDASCSFWERGNRIFDGFLVEYALYPEDYIPALQEKDHREGKQLRKRMFATGNILYDPHKKLRDMQQKARESLYNDMPKLTHVDIELKKYYLWDQLDNLIDLHERGEKGFVYAYFVGLKEILEFYAAFKQRELPRPNRLSAFLTDDVFREAYMIQGIDDPVFERIFFNAMEVVSLENIERATNHVHEKTGGFNVETWTLRGEL